MKVCFYHGKTRASKPLDLEAYDVVITTYGIVSAEWSGPSPKHRNPLYLFDWFRIVLDEGQSHCHHRRSLKGGLGG